MKVLTAEPFGRDELLARLRETRLMGFDQPLVYAHATLELAPAVPTK